MKNIMKFCVFSFWEVLHSNIFTTNLTYKVVIRSNLNSPLKLFFCPPIIVSNNLLFRIYYENIINVSFLISLFNFFFFSFDLKKKKKASKQTKIGMTLLACKSRIQICITSWKLFVDSWLHLDTSCTAATHFLIQINE